MIERGRCQQIPLTIKDQENNRTGHTRKDKSSSRRLARLIRKSKIEKGWKVQKKHLEFNLHLKVCTKSDAGLYPL